MDTKKLFQEMREDYAHRERLEREKREGVPEKGAAEGLQKLWGVVQEKGAEIAGAAFDSIYGPRGAAEDIRHKMEKSWYGEQVTPWSHDPAKKPGHGIHGSADGNQAKTAPDAPDIGIDAPDRVNRSGLWQAAKAQEVAEGRHAAYLGVDPEAPGQDQSIER
ncbi:hypothetical protein JL101_035925 (plasmid) [Skermanella rosea]|uniref:hypothetical protein n=1 Tax=Skermanella rosea TaxID=1817965 RepID=UPI0019327F56|nr:hypothetical protein [Skermanella rosea]UEM08042.1 hypothetical protein JL101_035925 [Skermanella rosea]